MRIAVLAGIIALAVLVFWATDEGETADGPATSEPVTAERPLEPASVEATEPSSPVPATGGTGVVKGSSKRTPQRVARAPVRRRALGPPTRDAAGGRRTHDAPAGVGVAAHVNEEGPDPGERDDEERGMIYAATPEGIRGAVQEAAPKIKECYEGWVAANPDLAGHLKVSFTISTETDADEIAHVTRAHVVDSELAHGLLEGCVLNMMEGLSFDPPEDGEITVTYPFKFDTAPPKDGPDAGP
jgi:hypothetical protein